jgi:hypothetical protein
MKRTILLACVVSLWLPGVVTNACCPVGPSGRPIVNADQTVVIVWDAKSQTQHFIRQASFRGTPEAFGFLIPTPSMPEVTESGDDGFAALKSFTEPERRTESVQAGFGCGAPPGVTFAAKTAGVSVLQEQIIGGLHTVVLEASNAADLAGWLKTNGFADSPQVQAWVAPYVTAGWKIFAYKLAKDAGSVGVAKALRLSFKTDKPVFPYREPDGRADAAALNNTSRLLRIYFVADARYEGRFADGFRWGDGKVAWAGPLSDGQARDAATKLKLPAAAAVTGWWLTEFEHAWPYGVAPGDLYFERDADQSTVARPPIITYVVSQRENMIFLSVCGLVFLLMMAGAVLVLRAVLRWFRRA